MKILEIYFKNINALRGTHHIDFTKSPFDTSPLFAITGPTGSGKSTLLDVISLALFNQVPRLGKISKKEILTKGALLTRNQKEASASVKYRCNAGIFTSSWSISTNRNHQLRDYEMEIADATGSLLDIKRSQVPAQNETLIGLNYDQFIKSVLLAQGEFAQFIKAKKDERGALLEKITGTGIYRDLGKKAYERFKSEGLKIEKQQNEIQTHRSELLEDADFEEHTKAFNFKKENIARIELEIKKSEKDLALKEALAKIEKDIAAAEQEQHSGKKKMEGFLQRSGSLLSNHEKVRPIADELRKWSALQEQITDLSKKKTTLAERKKENTKAVDDHLERAGLFIGRNTTPKTLERGVLNFTETVRKLQTALSDKRIEHAAAKRLITEQAKETAFELDSETDNLARLENLLSASEKKLSNLVRLTAIEPTTDIAAFREDLKHKLARSQQLDKNAIALDQEQKNQQQYSIEAEQLKIDLKAIPKDIELAKAKAKQFEAEANALQKAQEIDRLRASLDAHRAELQENEACPLCGSLEHPFAKHLPPNEKTEQELLALIKSSKMWNDALVSHTSKLKILENRNVALTAKLMSIGGAITALTEEMKALNQGLNLKAETDWEEFSSECRQKLEMISDLEIEKKLLRRYNELRPNLEKLAVITVEGQEIRAQLRKKYTGDAIQSESQELLKKWAELEGEQTLLNHQFGETETALQNKRLESQFLEKTLAVTDSLAHFKTVGEAQKSLLDERTFNRLQVEKSEITKALDHFDTKIELLKSQLETAKKTEVGETMEQVKDILETKRDELKYIRDKRNELERALTNHRKKTEKIADLKKQIATEEKQIKRWKLLNTLIGDAQGKRFNDFAQDLTLRHLVSLANIRLTDLSDRYRLDIPADDEDDGLVVLDDHMGSQRRSVRTLSGGETFLLSLSMALALSDLASSHVEINSLFIDEGFGTLDPETLDQTLDTLEKLQSESSKTIGIISHVDSLKERIATQIQLKRNGQGYSSLRVVS